MRPSVVRGIFRLLVPIIIIAIIGNLWGGGELISQTKNKVAITIIIFQLIIEVVVLLELLTISINTSSKFTKLPTIDHINLQDFDEIPDIDIVIPTRYPDIDILETTLKSIRSQEYPQDKIHIYLGNDTPEVDMTERMEVLINNYQVRHIYDPSNIKYKAGMLNKILPLLQSTYSIFLDYDQMLTKNSIAVLVSEIQKDSKISFIQGKKEFRGLGNFVRKWSALIYLQFFEVIGPRKSSLNAMFFAGSTAIFRTQHIRKIGGFSENTFVEDTDTTILLLLNGMYGKMVNYICSIGTVPGNYTKAVRQIWRWSNGGTHTFSLRAWDIIRSNKLSIPSKLETLSTIFITPSLTTAYMYGLTFLPLVFMGVDSTRKSLMGVDTIFLMPLVAIGAYSMIALYAISLRNEKEESDFRTADLLKFIMMSMAVNIMIIDATVLGFLRRRGPQSPRGRWNPELNIQLRGAVFSITALSIMAVGTYFLSQGYDSALIIVGLGATFFAPIVMAFAFRNY